LGASKVVGQRPEGRALVKIGGPAGAVSVRTQLRESSKRKEVMPMGKCL
jgi:hypothetical protein